MPLASIASYQFVSVTRPAPKTQTTAPVSTAATDNPVPDLKAPDVRDLFGDFEAEAARTRKAFALERLENLKEQMKTLKLFTLVPGALTGQTARMAQELENAAKDFTGSVKTLARTQARDSAEEGRTTGAAAYLATLADTAFAPLTLSQDDRDTMSDFSKLAVFLADTASFSDSLDPDRARRDGNGEKTRESALRVVDLMGSLADAAVSRSIRL